MIAVRKHDFALCKLTVGMDKAKAERMLILSKEVRYDLKCCCSFIKAFISINQAWKCVVDGGDLSHGESCLKKYYANYMNISWRSKCRCNALANASYLCKNRLSYARMRHTPDSSVAL